MVLFGEGAAAAFHNAVRFEAIEPSKSSRSLIIKTHKPDGGLPALG
jgi:hypothetical protein